MCGGARKPEAFEHLLEAVREEFRRTQAYTGRAAPSPRVLAALRRVDRSTFVPEQQQAWAYTDRPLPIGHGQTISQPYIVALMTELLDLAPGDRVLEVGTGSGYQAAVLAELAAEVYSIELLPELAAQARARLEALGYTNIHLRRGDARAGWPEAAPFDAIVVTAAAETIPEALLEQLAPGGRLVVPVGAPDRTQRLMYLTRDADGGLNQREVLPVAFVPLVRPSAP